MSLDRTLVLWDCRRTHLIPSHWSQGAAGLAGADFLGEGREGGNMITDWAGQGAEMNVNLNVSGTWICAYVSMAGGYGEVDISV